ncbi:hypothetical protein C7460_13128 [Marinoscillum furvescens DSM 4134]|uniref:Glycosyl transferase family 2 n=2 Tax=Marinoscillum furvescens TaxID=1026 RepID=A0A3D9KWE7_MARFU|nr:hypothetical protein C7460_13128 [Marinoscillum furvescens DSM 4134]
MQAAAKQAPDTLQVQLAAVRLAGDQLALPKDITELQNLNRTVLDIRDFRRKVPYTLIDDLLNSALQQEADFYCYTNMDIILQPNFYQFVAAKLEAGHDALIINRRRIDDAFLDKPLEEIYEEPGLKHPGFDCFIFSKAIAQQMILSTICVGVPFVGVSLAHNLFAQANNLGFYDDQHLTKHVGLEVMPPQDPEYYWHNRKAFFQQVLPKLKPDLKVAKIPYGDRPLVIRLWKWATNPSLFTWVNCKLMIREWWRR